MTFEEWERGFDAALSMSVREYAEAAWKAATMVECARCAKLVESIDDFGLVCKHEMAELIRARKS